MPVCGVFVIFFEPPHLRDSCRIDDGGGGEGEGHPKKSANMIDTFYDALCLEAE